jgi:hypothetical protein
MRSRNLFGDKFVLKTLMNSSDPKILRTPAVTCINKKIMIIWGLESPFNKSVGDKTPASNSATTQIKKVNAGLKISL